MFRDPKRLIFIFLLAVAWCVLWQSVSFANVLVGLILAVAIVRLGLAPPATGRVHFGPLMTLTWVVFLDLVSSTAAVALAVISRSEPDQEAVVAVPLPESGRFHHLFLSVAITLTPGSAVVDVDSNTNVLYVHLLDGNQHEAIIAHGRRMAELVDAALPTSSRSGAST